MRSSVHRMSKKKMRKMRRLVFFDDGKSCNKPLSFIEVNVNGDTWTSEVFTTTLSYLAPPLQSSIHCATYSLAAACNL